MSLDNGFANFMRSLMSVLCRAFSFFSMYILVTNIEHLPEVPMFKEFLATIILCIISAIAWKFANDLESKL
jgi:hypothetical protein